MAASEGFSAQTTRLTTYGLATLIGELTYPAYDEAQRHLAAALDMTHSAVIVDMNALTFCDSSGITALAGLHRQASRKGVIVVLTGLTGRVLQLFTIAGVTHCYTIHPDLDAAFRSLEGLPGSRP